MMKEICAQCLQPHVDPATGKHQLRVLLLQPGPAARPRRLPRPGGAARAELGAGKAHRAVDRPLPGASAIAALPLLSADLNRRGAEAQRKGNGRRRALQSMHKHPHGAAKRAGPWLCFDLLRGSSAPLRLCGFGVENELVQHRCDRRAAAADAMHEVRLPRLQAVCRSDRARRGRHQPMPAGRRSRCRVRSRRCWRLPYQPLESSPRSRTAAQRGLHPRGAVHRLHAVHPGLPGRRHRRRRQAHAHGADRRLHGLRAVRAALSGRLHRHAPAHRACPAGFRVCCEGVGRSRWPRTRAAGGRATPPICRARRASVKSATHGSPRKLQAGSIPMQRPPLARTGNASRPRSPLRWSVRGRAALRAS